MKYNIYVKTTIKPPRRADASAMYLVEYISDNKPDEPATLTDFLQLPETTETALVLTALIKALNRIVKPCEICIFTECKPIFANLESRVYEGWRGSKWHGTQGNIIKNNELWEILSGQLLKHKWTVSDEKHSYSDWMEGELKKWHKA